MEVEERSIKEILKLTRLSSVGDKAKGTTDQKLFYCSYLTKNLNILI